ncbi:superinfection immunity protein [Streptomyces sp. 21So2-11]|uniref:superinfection immunity protein n=1 Tax=Streptomyces sp. 21So2-11 TaxID=3144408 RepID=UPI00321C19A5
MDSLLTVLLGVVIAVIYLLPSYLAFARGSKDRWLILVINVAFGASLIGWGVALYLATRTPKRTQPLAQ